MNKFLCFGFLSLLLFTQCGSDDGDPNPDLTAEFDFILSNNGLVPATLSLTSKATADIYNWFINDMQVGFGPSITYEITEENFYILQHETIRNPAIVRKSDTLWVYAPEFSTAEDLAQEAISCQSFNFQGLTFSFETAASNGTHFDQDPEYYPQGDPDLGADSVFFLFKNEHILLYDANVSDESGGGIYTLNVLLETKKVLLDFNFKFYIRLDQGCITSIKVADLD